MKTMKINYLSMIFALFVMLAPPASASAFVESGQCLSLLYNVFHEDKNTYQLSVKLLMNGDERERHNLLSICYAFDKKPAIFAEHVRDLIESTRQKPVWGKPLYNGTVFTTLPGTGSFGYMTSGTAGHDIWTPAIGQFVNVDHGDDLDYVISFWTNINYFNNVPSYYQAVYINVKNGWTMNACESNIPSSLWSSFSFLVNPCP